MSTRWNYMMNPMTGDKRKMDGYNNANDWKHSELNVRRNADDQGLAAIYETLKSQPAGLDLLIQTGGAMSGN